MTDRARKLSSLRISLIDKDFFLCIVICSSGTGIDPDQTRVPV
jgi:hypothetical protein